MPRYNCDHADVKSDFFAVGPAIFNILVGSEVFPGLDHFHDEDEIERRFEEGEFPTDKHVCDFITSKCWQGEYGSRDEVIRGTESVE